MADAADVLFKAVLQRKSMGNCPASLLQLVDNLAQIVRNRLLAEILE